MFMDYIIGNHKKKPFITITISDILYAKLIFVDATIGFSKFIFPCELNLSLDQFFN